jgi:hypothetical protein
MWAFLLFFILKNMRDQFPTRKIFHPTLFFTLSLACPFVVILSKKLYSPRLWGSLRETNTVCAFMRSTQNIFVFAWPKIVALMLLNNTILYKTGLSRYAVNVVNRQYACHTLRYRLSGLCFAHVISDLGAHLITSTIYIWFIYIILIKREREGEVTM